MVGRLRRGKIVLLDDLDSDCLSHYLKIWSDRYSCTGEVKGGQVKLQHDYFVVTSNISIDEMFCDKQTILAAIKRFIEINIPNSAQVPTIPDDGNLRKIKKDVNQVLLHPVVQTEGPGSCLNQKKRKN
jgi:hypothetical protein